MWMLLLGILLVVVAIVLVVLWFVVKLSPIGRIWEMRRVLKKLKGFKGEGNQVKELIGEFLQTGVGKGVQGTLGISISEFMPELEVKQRASVVSIAFWILFGCLLISGIVFIVSYFLTI